MTLEQRIAALERNRCCGRALFMFQVGVPDSGHIHYASLTKPQAESLIHNTSSTIPVADPLQPYVVITTESNGNSGDNHIHDLTVYFDYVNHTFIVTNISNNDLYNHEAHLIGTINPENNLQGFDTMAEAILSLGLNKMFYYNATNLEGATAGSIHYTITL